MTTVQSAMSVLTGISIKALFLMFEELTVLLPRSSESDKSRNVDFGKTSGETHVHNRWIFVIAVYVDQKCRVSEDSPRAMAWRGQPGALQPDNGFTFSSTRISRRITEFTIFTR
jgi:hypothetical protein